MNQPNKNAPGTGKGTEGSGLLNKAESISKDTGGARPSETARVVAKVEAQREAPTPPRPVDDQAQASAATPVGSEGARGGEPSPSPQVDAPIGVSIEHEGTSVTVIIGAASEATARVVGAALFNAKTMEGLPPRQQRRYAEQLDKRLGTDAYERALTACREEDWAVMGNQWLGPHVWVCAISQKNVGVIEVFAARRAVSAMLCSIDEWDKQIEMRQLANFENLGTHAMGHVAANTIKVKMVEVTRGLDAAVTRAVAGVIDKRPELFGSDEEMKVITYEVTRLVKTQLTTTTRQRIERGGR